jgi:hypothetical protein
MTTVNDMTVKNQYGETAVLDVQSGSSALADAIPAKTGITAIPAIATVDDVAITTIDLVVESIADIVAVATADASTTISIAYDQTEVQAIATLANANKVAINLTLALVNDLKAKLNLHVALVNELKATVNLDATLTNADKAKVNAILAAMKVVA